MNVCMYSIAYIFTFFHIKIYPAKLKWQRIASDCIMQLPLAQAHKYSCHILAAAALPLSQVQSSNNAANVIISMITNLNL